MTWSDLKLRILALIQRSRLENELDDEMQFHLEMQSRKNEAAGEDELEASRLARLQFGAIENVKEACRDARGTRLIEDSLADVRYALRTFRRSPTFVLTVVATIALALGVNAALFTFFNAYVLRPVAVRDPYSLYRYTWTNESGVGHSFSWPEFEAFRDGNPAFSEVIGLKFLFARVEGHPLLGELVTGNYFRMLGVGAFAGRVLQPEDALSPGSSPVVVLSYSAWRNKLGGDPGIVGKSILFHGYPLHVIGIAKREFSGLTPRDFWIPITMATHLEDRAGLLSTGFPNRLNIVGRLRTEFTPAQAKAALSVLAKRTTAANSHDERAEGILLESQATTIPLTPDVMARFAPIWAAFLLVLLIGCANITNMMLSRAMARQREIGIRLSLGAARTRLVRQLLTESLILAVPAALAGLVLSEATLSLGQNVMFSLIPSDFAQIATLLPLHPDIRVFGFLCAAAAASAVLFGLAPAIQATRLDVSQATRGEFAVGLRPTRLRNALVVTQITACALLLTCAGLSLGASGRASTQDVGFSTKGILELEFQEKHRAGILTRLVDDPVVQAIGAVQSPPLDGVLPTVPSIAGEGAIRLRAAYNFVSPSFFTLLNVPILQGRNFSREEAQMGAPVAIVSQKTALQLWPAQAAIGKDLRLAPEPRVSRESRIRRFPDVRIIGVAADIVSCCLTTGLDPSVVYLPSTPADSGNSLLVRVRGNEGLALRALDARLATAVSPGALDQIHRLEVFRAGQIFPFRAAVAICTLIAGLALLLAASGIFGLLSYTVSQRTREVGIRMALGASPGAVERLVVLHSMKLALIGSVIGSVLATGVWRLLASHLLFMNTFDGLAFLAGAIVPPAASVAAAYFPARRAARIDPATTLRFD